MIEIAVVGVGGMGKTHIQNLLCMEGVTITDICDRNPKALEIADQIGAAFYESFEQMLIHTTATTILICTPTFLHCQQITAVLQAKKHCIVEKPLCLSSREARALWALAQEQNRYLFVGQVIRFWEEYEYAAALVKGKKYGEVVDVSFQRLTACPQWSAGNWLFDKSKSGLIPFDLHIHEVDFMVSLFGKPKRLVAQSGGVEGNHGMMDYYRVLYFYDGLTVCAESSWYQAPIPFTQDYRIYFEKALLHYDGNKIILYHKDGEPEQIHLNSGLQKLQTSINVMPTNAYYHELVHYLDCISKNKPSDKITMTEVIAVLETIEEMVGEHYFSEEL